MDTSTVVQKSQLAKLMATENITVEHRKTVTAMFDAQKRVLVLPIWKEMDSFMYDHLTGHEVGHAIWTPVEGWHNAVVKENKGKFYKGFLNVIEDIRIEKKVQRKYPGLKRSFIKSYQNLLERDFFGVKNKDIRTLPFIDRLNIFSKSQYTEFITFSEQEEILVEKAKAVETWDDVLRVTDEIYQFSKEEQQQVIDQQHDFQYDDSEDYDYESTDDPFEQDLEEDFEQDSNEDPKQNFDQNDEANDDDQSEEEPEVTEDIKEEKESSFSDGDFDPKCQTDENYRNREQEFISDESKEYFYFDFPKPIIENILVPAKSVQNSLKKCFEPQILSNENVKKNSQKIISDFRKSNERYVGLLAKEFEMRKAASRYAKTRNSVTGDLNINKLSNYKFDDNIFKKIALKPDGKSHGLIILLDYSGSMQSNMSGSIEQLLIMTMFCRKVNIPFRVFAFSNSTANCVIDEKFDKNGKMVETFEQGKQKNLLMNGGVFLREYINSEMNNSEYKNSIENLILLKNSFEEGSDRIVYRAENLGNTPLIEALVACKDIMVDFKKKNNLDITSLVIVQDGDADAINCFQNEIGGYTYFNPRRHNVFLSDNKNKFQQKLRSDDYSSSEAMTEVTINWFKKLTGSKVIGFYIMPNHKRYIRHAIEKNYIDDEINFNKMTDSLVRYEKLEILTEKIKKEKYLCSKREGYNNFFLVTGGKELKLDENNLLDEKKMSINQIKNNFIKQNKKREVSRVFVNKFIESIATI